MGCTGNKSAETKDDKPRDQRSNIKEDGNKQEEPKEVQGTIVDVKKKEDEKEERKKEEEKKLEEEKKQQDKKKDESKIGEDELEKDDDIEIVSFTQNTMNLEKMRKLELAEHNFLRSLHGSPPLILNKELNDIAQNYATKLAKINTMKHSNEEDRYLKGKKGEWVGENLYSQMSSGELRYVCGDMSKSWYSEIKDYNFQTGKSTGVTGHFTQLVWVDSKEVGFGVAFNGGFLIAVANYFPGGNFNMGDVFAQQIPCLIPQEKKTCKDLFNLENAKKRELGVMNLVRKKNNVGNLELDEELCNYATKFAEDCAKTGSISTVKQINGVNHSTNSCILNLKRGALYKGGEGTKKMYNEFKSNKNNRMSQIMGQALIKYSYKKIGFGYYFEDDNKLYFFAVFDSW